MSQQRVAPDLDVLASPRRLEAVARAHLLDAPPDEAFDRATRVASRHLDAPVALVSIVDERRQFFKSMVGLGEPWASARETPLSHSFCQYVVAMDAPLVVTDARQDPLVAGNKAIEDLGVVSYSGVPLRDGDGQVLGALSVIRGQPTAWGDGDVELLQDLAATLQAELRHRDALARALQLEQDRADMLAVLGHDLRGPLGAVIGLASTILQHGSRLSGEQVQEMLDAIARQARQCGEVVDRALTAARG